MYTSITRRLCSIVLALSFLFTQISPSSAQDCLSAPSGMDDILPSGLKNDIAQSADPGAIGNGQPLIDLVAGKLPDRLLEHDLSRVTKVREALDIAINRAIVRMRVVPSHHRERAEAALINLELLQEFLSKRLHLFNAIVTGPEDYLLGFNTPDTFGLSVELIDDLYAISPLRLAQYIYHEAVPEYNMSPDRTEHRAIYKELQRAVFDAEEVAALGRDLRGFITTTLTVDPELATVAAEVEAWMTDRENGFLKTVAEILAAVMESGNTGAASKTGEPLSISTIRTKADTDISAAIITALKDRYPDHYIISEEMEGQDAPDIALKGFTHVIDELDGTMAFDDTVMDPHSPSRGQYGFAYGLYYDGKPLLALFFMPDFFRIEGYEGLAKQFPSELPGMLFMASINREGAYMNGRRMVVAPSYNPSRDATAVHSHDINEDDGYTEWNYGVVRGYAGNLTEEICSTIYEFCMIGASGMTDADGQAIFPRACRFIAKPVPAMWDSVIGGFILEKAGGRFTYPDGATPMLPFTVNPAQDAPTDWRTATAVGGTPAAIDVYTAEVHKDLYGNLLKGLRLGNHPRSVHSLLEKIFVELTDAQLALLIDAVDTGIAVIRANHTDKHPFRKNYETGYLAIRSTLQNLRTILPLRRDMPEMVRKAVEQKAVIREDLIMSEEIVGQCNRLISGAVDAAYLLKMFISVYSDLRIDQKADKSLVTPADTLINDVLKGKFEALGIPVIGEESKHDLDVIKSGTYIALDPIDGTSNFVAAFNGELDKPALDHVTLISLVRDGVPVIGVCMNHYTGELDVAICNGNQHFESHVILGQNEGLSFSGVPAAKRVTDLNSTRALIMGGKAKDPVNKNYHDIHLTETAQIGGLGTRIIALCNPVLMNGLVYHRSQQAGLWDLAAPYVFASLRGVHIRDGFGDPLSFTRGPFFPGRGAIATKFDGLGYYEGNVRMVRERNLTSSPLMIIALDHPDSARGLDGFLNELSAARPDMETVILDGTSITKTNEQRLAEAKDAMESRGLTPKDVVCLCDVPEHAQALRKTFGRELPLIGVSADNKETTLLIEAEVDCVFRDHGMSEAKARMFGIPYEDPENPCEEDWRVEHFAPDGVPYRASPQGGRLRTFDRKALLGRIGGELDVRRRAKAFAAAVSVIAQQATSDPTAVYVLAIDNLMFERGFSALNAFTQDIRGLQDAKGPDGKPLLPSNLRILVPDRKTSLGGELQKMIGAGEVRAENISIVTSSARMDEKAFEDLEGRAMIAAIEKGGVVEDDYMYLLEVATLTILANLDADPESIQGFYNAIARTPVPPEALDDMLARRIIRILPRIAAVDPDSLPTLYEAVLEIYLSA